MSVAERASNAWYAFLGRIHHPDAEHVTVGPRGDFRTEERTGKTRRIRANGRVLVAPCDNRGKPLGQAVAGHARIVLPEDEPHAESAIQANFGLGRRLCESVAMNLGPKGVFMGVTPAGGEGQAPPAALEEARGDAGGTRAVHKQRAPRGAGPTASVDFLCLGRRNSTLGGVGGLNGAFLPHSGNNAPNADASSLGALFLDPLEAPT